MEFGPVPTKPESNPAENLQSRLLLRAQELGRLDYLVERAVEGRYKEIPLLLVGMISADQPPARKVELDAAEAELQKLVDWLFFEQVPVIQELLASPVAFRSVTYVQAYEHTREGVPEGAIRAMLTGWLIGLGKPHPAMGAMLLARALKKQVPLRKAKKVAGRKSLN